MRAVFLVAASLACAPHGAPGVEHVRAPTCYSAIGPYWPFGKAPSEADDTVQSWLVINATPYGTDVAIMKAFITNRDRLQEEGSWRPLTRDSFQVDVWNPFDTQLLVVSDSMGSLRGTGTASTDVFHETAAGVYEAYTDTWTVLAQRVDCRSVPRSTQN